MKQSSAVKALVCLLLCIYAGHTYAQRALHRFAGTQNNITDFSFSKDGSLVLVSSADGLLICDANTEQVKATIPLQGKVTAALSPDNNTLLIANDNNELEVYALQNGGNARLVSKRKLQVHIGTLDFRADGRYYAMGTDDGRIAVMNAQHMDAFMTIMEAVPFAGKKAGTDAAVSTLRFIDNDRLMVFARNGEVKAFDVNSGRQVYALEYYRNVIYSPADDAPVQCDVAPAAKRLLCSRSGNAFILDLETYDIKGRTAQTGLRSCAIAPSGSVVIACDATHIYVYNSDFSHKDANRLSPGGISGNPDIRKLLISPAVNKVAVQSGNELLIGDYQLFSALAGK
jgi:WD40 repeat protein